MPTDRHRGTSHTPCSGGALISAAALAAITLSGCSPVSAQTGDQPDAAAKQTVQAPIEVRAAWVRATDGTNDPTMTAAFMQLHNPSNTRVRLIGTPSDAADAAEVHEMADIDGRMVMQQKQGGVLIDAGSTVTLEPGGNHIMLMQMQRDLAAGDEVQLTLRFANASAQTVTLPVKAFSEEKSTYHGGGHSHSKEDKPNMPHSGSMRTEEP